MAIRHWSPLRLALLWGGVALLCLAVRSILLRGTIQGRIIDHSVSDITGQWSPAFASGATMVVLVVSAISLVVVTAIWLRGREERSKRKIANDSADNRILIGPPRPSQKKSMFKR